MRAQPATRAGRGALARRLERVAADERPLAPHERPEARIERRVEHRHLGAVVAKALLHPQRVERAIAEDLETRLELGGRGGQRVPHEDRRGRRRRELPAELAGVTDP